MFNASSYREEMQRRIATIHHLLETADPPLPPPDGIYIGREIRGLVILLLFASYENLLKSLCRGLLEKAVSLRIGNHRLRPGFRQFAVHSCLMSVASSAEGKIWEKSGKKLLEVAFEGRACTINTSAFPSNGKFMKTSQVVLF